VILHIDTAEAMEAFGSKLGQHCQQGSSLYLQGDLGAGKTTLVRGFMHSRGYKGKVKSPTYTLVEPYELRDTNIFHFDLYRLEQPGELENIGFRDYFDAQAIILVEWPEKADTLLPQPDLLIIFTFSANGRSLEIKALSEGAREVLTNIQ